MRAGVALGSNLGDRLGNLKKARAEILRIAGATPPVLASNVYETPPVNCEPGAGTFLNAVMEIGYDGEPRALLRELRRIEATLGRPAEHERNVSRVIDLDILYLGDQRVTDEDLELPHPRMFGRAFVMKPLADIRPELVLPGHQKSARDLLASLPESGKLERLTEDWKA